MKVQLTNPISGQTTTASARLTTDHPASSYGQPVMLIAGVPIDIVNAVMQGARIVVMPKRADQVRMLEQWQKSACTMLGIQHATERKLSGCE